MPGPRHQLAGTDHAPVVVGVSVMPARFIRASAIAPDRNYRDGS